MTKRPAWIDAHEIGCPAGSVYAASDTACTCGHHGLKAYAIPEGVVGEAFVRWDCQPVPPTDGRYWLVRVVGSCYELVRQDAEPHDDFALGVLLCELRAGRKLSRPALFVSGNSERWIQEAATTFGGNEKC